MKKAISFLRKNPEIIFFICAFILWTMLMCYENTKEGGDFSWHDLKVEANGMIFDLFVFGILVTTYNAIRARKEKIERLKEEIDDFRGWDEKEAKFRISGAIKRLNRLGVSVIDLSYCFLEKASLSQIDLNGAWLFKTNLKGSMMSFANLRGAHIEKSELQNAHLYMTDLRNAKLSWVSLYEADLREAKLEGIEFDAVNLRKVNLDGAWVEKDWFEKLEYWQVIGREEIKEKYYIDEDGQLNLK